MDCLNLPFFNDKEIILADPVDPDHVYAAWGRLNFSRGRGPAGWFGVSAAASPGSLRWGGSRWWQAGRGHVIIAARLAPMTEGSPESCSFTRRVPAGDNRERLVCDDCGFILYDNPKIVVGAVCTWEDRILLCRRAIEPRTGYWTIPAGFLELQESCEEGAVREAWEEARARLKIDCLLAVYSIPRISQVQIIYRARLLTQEVAAGPESEAVRLFTWDEIPWEDLAFPSIHWSLRQFYQTREQASFPAFAAPTENQEGRR